MRKENGNHETPEISRKAKIGRHGRNRPGGADGQIFADGIGLFYRSDDVGVFRLEVGDGLVKAAGDVWGGGCFELEGEAAAAFFEDEVERRSVEGSGDLLGQGGLPTLPRPGENDGREMGEAFAQFEGCGAPERLHIDRLTNDMQALSV